KEDMDKEDRDSLEKCHRRYLHKEYHSEALHLFARNAQVDAHNEEMIEKICTNIRTFYEVDSNDKEIKQNESKHTKKINKPLRLAKNARVMMTKNICVNDGLANGVTGRIVEFVENDYAHVSHIIIKCDSPKVGRLHRVSCPHCHGRDTICVIRENDSIDQQDFDVRSKKAIKQFPLRLSWAMTIHKAQGITVDQVVISTKDFFGSGMGYTALSRVRTLEGLFLIDVHFDKFYCNENVDRVLSQMKEMKRKAPIFRDSSEFLNILFHNIEGLKCNFNAFRNYHLRQKADLICLVETWLNDIDQADEFRLNGYNLFYKTRSSSFQSNHSLHSQKGGGIAIYFRENYLIKKIDSSKKLNLEYFTIEIEKNNITIITCYRSPQQSKCDFLINLIEHLQEINNKNHILLIGDLNEDCLQNKSKPIETKMKSLGFTNIFKKLPTTNNLTSLDCVYSNFNLEVDECHDVVGTYYSFHEALIFSVEKEKKATNLNKQVDINIDDGMDVNDSLQISTPVFQKSEKLNKRKNNSKEKKMNKFLKKTNVSSTIAIINNSLKEKQIRCLRNLKSALKVNFPSKLSSEFSLDEQLGSLGLKKVNIIGDGNCFFRAISHQLHRHENEHLGIRSIAIEYLIYNMNDLSDFIDETYSTIGNYIEQMSLYGTYADHLVISATAIIINKNIIIHELGKRPILIPGSDFIDDQLHICYDPHILHYDSVLCINDNSAFLSPEELLIIL
ncbi:unnamed protein product, partial [Rotaria sordida]